VTKLSRQRETGRSRLIAEFLLIVAGVTVALGADSLWSLRQDHARESEYLEQLSADLAENRARLDAAILDEETLGAAALAALEALARESPIAADSARAWLVERRGFMYSDPRLLTGTFSGLIESGDLRLIRDPDVRKSIIAYLPQITADRAEFDRWVDEVIEGFRAFRPVALGLPNYYHAVGEAGVQALSAVPVHPLMGPVLDVSVWTNEIRLIYLRRMLAATEQTSSALEQ
jgi:hypothetical protein